MKIDGLTHPKTKDLAIRLGVSLPCAVGHLEFLWYFVGKQTPRGDVGKWSNGVIAAESHWQDDADHFIESLIDSGFIDESEKHRLVIHDWQDHAPRWVFAKLKKENKEILSADLSGDLSGRYKGSEVKGSEVKGSDTAGADGGKPPVRKTSLPKNFTISDRVKRWAKEKGHGNLEEHFENFITQAEAKGYKYVDWDAAFMNAVRQNWAKVGSKGGDSEADRMLRGAV